MPSVNLVEPKQVDPSLQDLMKSVEERFGHVPNLIRALANNPEMCLPVADFMLYALAPRELDWALKELLILKVLRSVKSYYGIAHHERLAIELGVNPEKIGDLADGLWPTSPHFSEAERSLLEFVEQVAEDANDVPDSMWERMRSHWNPAQLLEANAVITTFLMIGKLGDALGVSDPVLFKKPVTAS